MDNLRVYNTLKSKKETFTTIVKNKVGMYVCGPTVYSNVHLGNCRTFISFDLIYRYLIHLGYKVRYVRNITDVGHIENDDDQGEDKINKKARLEKIEPMEIVQKYTVDFHDTLNQFNTLPPSIEPTATGHIIEQIELIKKIIREGIGYEKNGSIYFDVHKFNKKSYYGKLSKRKLEDLICNTRSLDGQDDKNNPEDFALWKKAEPEHIMRWPSPWGDGFPGWHLECTAMSSKYLGDRFDIHGGGIDLKFPHHECEIAQSESINSKSPVNFWIHTNMMTLNGKKMSKSTGNSILPKDLISGNNSIFKNAFSPSVIKFYFFQAHYRNTLDLTEPALLSSEKAYNKLMESIELIESLKVNGKSKFNLNKWVKECYNAMNDDFNSPMLISKLFEAVKLINSVKNGTEEISQKQKNLLINHLNIFVFEILGLTKPNNIINNSGLLENTIKILIKLRDKARKNKDFEMADLIRNELNYIGVELEDMKDGSSYNIKY